MQALKNSTKQTNEVIRNFPYVDGNYVYYQLVRLYDRIIALPIQ